MSDGITSYVLGLMLIFSKVHPTLIKTILLFIPAIALFFEVINISFRLFLTWFLVIMFAIKVYLPFSLKFEVKLFWPGDQLFICDGS